MGFKWPLMEDNVTRQDLDALIEFLKGMPRLTQSANVQALEQEWSQWLGVNTACS
jgi:CDP-6-deoxy-D-xylo-4-hexulose-3-dehydrase